MKLTIIFKEEFEEHMKKQFGAFTNLQALAPHRGKQSTRACLVTE